MSKVEIYQIVLLTLGASGFLQAMIKAESAADRVVQAAIYATIIGLELPIIGRVFGWW